MVKFLLAVLMLTGTALGQIKLSELKTQTWAGLNKPTINADGTITTGPDSRPVIIATSTRYAFETAIPYKFGQLKVKRVGTGEKVSLDKDPAAEIYWFRSGATSGKYEFFYTVFDPEKGIDSDEWIVDYSTVQPPKPDDPPLPPKPDDPLTGVPESARKIMVGYVAAMATDMETVATEIRQNKLPNLPAVQARGQSLDLLTRTKFKVEIGKVMNDAVGDPAKPEAFEQIAVGYKAVK